VNKLIAQNLKAPPRDSRLLAKIQSEAKEVYLETRPGSYVTLQWILKNESSVFWPEQGVFLETQSPDLSFPRSPVPHFLSPKEETELSITFQLPPDYARETILLSFTLEDRLGVKFGDTMTAIIKVEKEGIEGEREKKQVVNPDDLTQFKLNDDSFAAMASILYDEGYGSFDRCFSVVKSVRGNLDLARERLTQLVFVEFGKRSYY